MAVGILCQGRVQLLLRIALPRMPHICCPYTGTTRETAEIDIEFRCRKSYVGNELQMGGVPAHMRIL